MKFVGIYTSEALSAFRRADKYCKNDGIPQIEAIYLARELMKDGRCKMYEFLQSKSLSDNAINNAMNDCITSGRIVEMRKEEHVSKIQVVTTENEVEIFTVSAEVESYILSLLDVKIAYFNKEDGSKIIGAKENDTVAIIIDTNDILNCITCGMQIDMVKFIRRLGYKAMDFVGELQEYLYKIYKEGNLDEKNLEFATRGKKEENTVVTIPEKMKSFLKDITSEVTKEGKKLILGREIETSKAWSILSKKYKRNAILVGEPGVGKTAIVYKMAEDIVYGDCPDRFRKFRIISLDISGIIAGTIYRGQAEERFKELTNFLENNKNVILFIDEIHTMIGAGSCLKGELDLANAMKPILAGGSSTVIGATTNREYVEIFSVDGALKRRFEKVEVEEPNSDEIYPMLKNKIKDLEKFHGVTIKKQVVDFIVLTAACFNYETRNPDRTLDLLDRSMVMAKRLGKGVVDRATVLENFDINFERFKNMSEEEKNSVAYHEAGHFIVHEMSGRLKEKSTLVVSIMPTDYYLGVNAYEHTEETVQPTMEYYIDLVAESLAGREAERMIMVDDNSGIEQDLQQATRIAYRVITKFAMVDGYKISYAYSDDEGEMPFISDSETEKINKSVEELIEKAEKRAREILEQNHKLLDEVATQLLRKKMLSKKELEKIIHKVNDPVNNE